MARTNKYLYYCVSGGAKYCHPLYNNTDKFSLVPSYKSLEVGCNNAKYYIPMSTNSSCSNTTKLHYNRYYIYNCIKYTKKYCIHFTYYTHPLPMGTSWSIEVPVCYNYDPTISSSSIGYAMNPYYVCYIDLENNWCLKKSNTNNGNSYWQRKLHKSMCSKYW